MLVRFRARARQAKRWVDRWQFGWVTSAVGTKELKPQVGILLSVP